MPKTYDQTLQERKDYDEQRQLESARYWRKRLKPTPTTLSLRYAYLKVGGDIPTLHKFIKSLSSEDKTRFLAATPKVAKEMFEFWGKQ